SGRLPPDPAHRTRLSPTPPPSGRMPGHPPETPQLPTNLRAPDLAMHRTLAVRCRFLNNAGTIPRGNRRTDLPVVQ
ncbi:MAG: hypothetical protein ACK53L_18975, partial [Pirellulaceae bacterium]